MKKGSRLLSFAGTKVVVDSVYCFRTNTATTVYNLEIKGNENYYVSASQVLVHNCKNSNPFKGKTFKQIEKKFKKKGFIKKGKDPVNGKGMYINPESGYKFYFDNGFRFGEKPHIDIFYPNNSYFEKSRWFLDGSRNIKVIK